MLPSDTTNNTDDGTGRTATGLPSLHDPLRKHLTNCKRLVEIGARCGVDGVFVDIFGEYVASLLAVDVVVLIEVFVDVIGVVLVVNVVLVVVDFVGVVGPLRKHLTITRG